MAHGETRVISHTSAPPPPPLPPSPPPHTHNTTTTPPPPPPEGGAGTRGDFLVGWFTPHFYVFARFRIDAWLADVACPVVCQPIWPACWLHTPDRSSSSPSRVVQDVWDVDRDELGVVPDEVVLALRDAASRPSVDDFWSIWSSSAELGLFRACSKAGGPTQAGSSAFLGRGLLRIRSRRLGDRAAGGTVSSKLYRVSQGDEDDVHCAQYFVHSSLSPVLFFRRRLKSVAGCTQRYSE